MLSIESVRLPPRVYFFNSSLSPIGFSYLITIFLGWGHISLNWFFIQWNSTDIIECYYFTKIFASHIQTRNSSWPLSNLMSPLQTLNWTRQRFDWVRLELASSPSTNRRSVVFGVSDQKYLSPFLCQILWVFWQMLIHGLFLSFNK